MKKLLTLYKSIDKSNKQKILEIIFCIGCFVIYLMWSRYQGYNYAPDEYMRYSLPEYIYKHNKLPLGNDPEVVNPLWGFSYAYLPLWLGSLLSAVCMKISFFISGNESHLLVAARFPSVIAGTVTVFLMFRILDKLVSTRKKWILTIILALTPQFIFLSSYVNNDALNIMGVSFILYAWVLALKEDWNVKSAGMLITGISVVALSYYFAYGWILCSVFLFFFTYILKVNKDNSVKTMFKWASIISIIVLILVLWAFIRNLIVYNGDLLGRVSMAKAQEQYAVEWLQPQNKLSLKKQGFSLHYMLYDLNWIETTFESTIGIFGYMSVRISNWIYSLYFGGFTISLLMFLSNYIELIFFSKEKEKMIRKKQLLLSTSLIICFAIPLFLNVYYSYVTDFQPQGRYSYSSIIAFIPMTGIGIDWYEKTKKKSIFFVLLIIIIICVYCSASSMFINSLG